MNSPKIIYIGCRVHCTSFLKPMYLANYLPLWLILELACFSQQSLITCLVGMVVQKHSEKFVNKSVQGI